MRVPGVAVVELMHRLRRKHYPSIPAPWEADGIKIVVLDSELWAWRRGDAVWPSFVGCWVDYEWDTEREYLPSAEMWTMAQRRVAAEVMNSPAVETKEGEADRKRWPTLVSDLCDDKYDDGSPRERSSINVWTEGSVYKAMVRDRNLVAVLYVAAPSLGKVYDVLEKMLNDPKADWRPDKHAKGAKRPKK